MSSSLLLMVSLYLITLSTERWLAVLYISLYHDQISTMLFTWLANSSAPRSTHYIVVLCILCYVNETLFHNLHFYSLSSLELRAYSDADGAGNPTDRYSTTNYYFLLGTSLVSWCNKKQSVIALLAPKQNTVHLLTRFLCFCGYVDF